MPCIITEKKKEAEHRGKSAVNCHDTSSTPLNRMPMDTDFYLNLLTKQLAGELSPEEANQLDSWLDDSPENRALAEEVEASWEAGGKLGATPDIDLDAAFAELEDRIEREEKETPVIPLTAQPSAPKAPSRNWMIWVGIAAGIALVAVMGWFLNKEVDPEITGPSFAEVSTLNERKSLELPDGSTVTLNTYSSIKYPTEFTGTTRAVELTGEARFDVKGDKAHSFVVSTPWEKVTVLGTVFNVRARPKEAKSKVYVSEGIVSIEGNSGGQGVVHPGELVSHTHESELVIKESGDYSNFDAWATGILVFADTPLLYAIDDLEAYYQIGITLDDARLNNCPFTSRFDQEELAAVLETLKTIYGFEVDPSGPRSYVLKGGVCG